MSACAAAGCSRAQAVCCFAGWNSRRFEPKRTSLQICSHACSVTQHAVVFSTFGDPNVQSSGHLVILDNAGNLLWDTLLPNPGPFALSAISLFEFVHDELLLVTWHSRARSLQSSGTDGNGNGAPASVAIGDLNGDGNLEVHNAGVTCNHRLLPARIAAGGAVV